MVGMTKKPAAGSLLPADTAESKESAETVRLAVGLAEEDRREESSWRIGSDPAAYGRKRLTRPDRPY